MKKKIIALSLAAIIAVTAIASVTLAYLSDTDEQTNVFTFGDVHIDLIEVYEPESKLLPGVDVQKEVDVKNTGSEDAYVRVHIAIPSMLDSGSEDEPQFAAYNNTLHWNMSKASMADGLWNWHSTNKNGANATMPGYPQNGGEWNFYVAEIDGISYNVYVATYETALASGETTADNAIHKVFLDTKVTNEMITEIIGVLGAKPEVKVFAEGCQTATFSDAYEALNTVFGTPGADGYVAPWNR